MYKYILLIFCAISCSKKDKCIVGKYKSEPLSISEKVLYSNNSDIRNLELTLQNDNPDFFIYEIEKNMLLSFIEKEKRIDIVKLKKE